MKFSLGKSLKIDWLLFLTVVILLALSISVLYSLNLNANNPDFLLFKKQIIFAVSGLVLFFIFANINYTIWATYSKLIFIIFSFILVAVLFFGSAMRGTTGWLNFGLVSVQPVEFAKLSLIILLARYFSDKAGDFKSWKYIFVSGFLTLIFIVLVSWQPDIGSALVFFGLWFIMLLFAGLSKKHFVWLLGIFLVVVVCGWFFILQDYQKSRLLTFIDPGRDPQGQGYNVLQSMVAVGSGQFFGRGLALGSQSSLRFLPEPGTDFIFAVIAEDLGLFGVTVLLGLFVFIFYRLFLTMKKSQDDFGAWLILGVVSMLLVQLFVNIGMNIGLSPVTGIPLPLVSAGGSSLWAVLIALGITQSIYLRNNRL
jgi:rod shape determining protein RodA